MKTNKTVKMLMALVLSFAMIMSAMMVPAMAAVGDTVNVDAEFGALIKEYKVNTTKADATTKALSTAVDQSALYGNYLASAYYAEDATHGNIAVMKKGVADAPAAAEEGVSALNRGFVISAPRDEMKWADSTNRVDEFITSIYFKVPVAENVTTYLFSGINSGWAARNEDEYKTLLTKQKNGVKVQNGYMYLTNGTQLNTTPITADTWYRMVRLTKGDGGTSSKAYEKVYVLDSSNTIISQSAEWTQIGDSYTTGSSWIFNSLCFTTDYPADYTGTEAAVSTMKLYKKPASSTFTASAMLEGSNRVLEYDASGTDVDSAPLGERITGSSYDVNRQKAYVTFRLPEGNGTLKLFRWNDANGKYIGAGTTHKDSFAVTVENGKVYANIYHADSVLNARATAPTSRMMAST